MEGISGSLSTNQSWKSWHFFVAKKSHGIFFISTFTRIVNPHRESIPNLYPPNNNLGSLLILSIPWDSSPTKSPCKGKIYRIYTLNNDFVLGGGFKDFLFFTPKLGENFQFDEHIFQRGWFNHQLDNFVKWLVSIGWL